MPWKWARGVGVPRMALRSPEEGESLMEPRRKDPGELNGTGIQKSESILFFKCGSRCLRLQELTLKVAGP